MKDISVVVPLYKGNKYIENIITMLESNYKNLQKNHYNATLECIFVNDFPKEQIAEIDSEYIDVHYIYHEKNCGIHKSRVDGIVSAKGKFIHMLDQDDIVADDYYLYQLEAMRDSDVVICNGFYHGNKLIFSADENEFDRNVLISKGNKIISPGQTLVKKNAIPIEWFENIVQNSGCDDWLLWILMVYKNASFSYNPKVSYYHVEDGNNQSAHWDRMSVSLKEIRAILEKESIENVELKMQSLKCIDKFIYDYEAFYQFEKIWGNIDKVQLFHYLSEHNIKQIAVYGYGNIGKKIVTVLKEYDASIWAMDRDVRYVDEDVHVYRPDEEVPEVDLMIVTPLRGGEQIKNLLKGKSKVRNSWLLEEFLFKINNI